MQEFEKHEKLSAHILRMASTGSVGSPSYWDDFISNLNDALLAPVPAMPMQEQSIDEKMKTAGMLSVAELLKGAPLDGFMKHAGVKDLDSLLAWAEIRRGECLRAQAAYDTGSKEPDDMYEWVVAHCAVFTELHVNLRAAIAGEKSKAMPIPKQEPAGAVPKPQECCSYWRNDAIENAAIIADRYEQNYCAQDIRNMKRGKTSPRITEQDALQIIKSWSGYFDQDTFEMWCMAKGSTLLDKLNKPDRVED